MTHGPGVPPGAIRRRGRETEILLPVTSSLPLRLALTNEGTKTPISNLARQQDHAIKLFMNEAAKIRNLGSGFAQILDRSCITPQTRPVG